VLEGCESTHENQQHRRTLLCNAENWIDYCYGKAAAGLRRPGIHDRATNLMFWPDRCVDFTTISWRKWELQRYMLRKRLVSVLSKFFLAGVEVIPLVYDDVSTTEVTW